jgi:hypothetical protein
MHEYAYMFVDMATGEDDKSSKVSSIYVYVCVMCVYMHTCVYMCVYMHTCVHYARTNVKRTDTSIHIHILHTYIHTYIQAYAYIFYIHTYIQRLAEAFKMDERRQEKFKEALAEQRAIDHKQVCMYTYACIYVHIRMHIVP